MTAAPARFTFDRDFGAAPKRTRAFGENELTDLLNEAEEKGRQSGLAEGTTSETAAQATALAEAAAAIAARTEDFATQIDAARAENLIAAANLAATIANKLCAHLVAKEPAAELAALISESLATLDNAPHLVIRCHPELADAIREHSDALLATSGFTGRLVVMGEPEIAIGDGRIEWADGGLVRDRDAIAAEIDTHIEAYLAAHAHAATEGAQ